MDVNANEKIRILLAEDHHVVRTAIASFLAKEPDIDIVGQVSAGNELLESVARLHPDLLLLDAHMPGHNVIDTARALCCDHPQTHILVLSAYDRREYVVGLLKEGAAGYVLKDDPPETLLRAIRTVAIGEEWVSPRVARLLVKSVRQGGEDKMARLTKREKDVLRLMAEGQKNSQIADKLVIAEQTVKNHVRNIFRKLDVETRVEAVLWAVEHPTL